jgi:hypothetical protein
MKNCSLDNDIVYYLFELDEFHYYIYTSNVFSRGVNHIINEFCFIRGLSFTKLWCSWPCHNHNIPKRKGSTHMVILEASMAQLNINVSLLFNSLSPLEIPT